MPSISVTNPELIVSMNLGDASPKLGGTVNLKNFRVIRTFYADLQDLIGFQSYDHITSFTTVHLQKNKLTGNVPDLSASASCAIALFNENNLDGNLPTTLPAGIQVFRAGNNALFKSDTHKIPDLSNYTSLAEFNITKQSADYGVSVGSGWFGPGELANEAVTTVDGIEGAIPESIRIFNYAFGNLSKDHKLILLTQLYDTFGSKPANWAKTTAVNGVTYATPKVSVNNGRGNAYGTSYLLGRHSTILITDAKAALTTVGFSLVGF